jgi:hypothetical protein
MTQLLTLHPHIGEIGVGESLQLGPDHRLTTAHQARPALKQAANNEGAGQFSTGRVFRHVLDVRARDADVGQIAVAERVELRNHAVVTLPRRNAGSDNFKHDDVLSVRVGHFLMVEEHVDRSEGSGVRALP